MSEKTVKEQIKEAENELLDLQINKQKRIVKRLRKRESVKDAHGETVKQVVKNARGETLNRTEGDD